MRGQTGDNGTKNVKIMVPLKYLSNVRRTHEMSLISCEINLDLNWSKNFTIVANNKNQDRTFSVTDTKLYVPVVSSSTQDNTKLLQQLKSGFKRTIKWKKYQLEASTDRQNQYLHFLTDSIFQGVKRLVLSFKDEVRARGF